MLNNLALAYTMSGEPERGEKLLRQANASGTDNAKVRQNLALVLGLQGKYDEATKMASVDLAPGEAQANTALLRKMVKLDAKPMTPAAGAWAPAVAQTGEAARAQPVKAAAATPASAAAAPLPALRQSQVETGFAEPAPRGLAASLFAAE